MVSTRTDLDARKLQRLSFLWKAADWYGIDQRRRRQLRSLLDVAVCVSLSLLLTTGASAQAPSGTTATQETSGKPATQASADERSITIVAEKLCRAEPIVGTRIPVRHRCDTPAQLAQYRQQAREIIEEYKRRPCVAGTGSGESDITLPC